MQVPVSLTIVGNSISRRLAMMALFTAVYSVFRYIPTFPMYGVSGTSFRASDFLAPLLGILLGPWLALPCIIIGTVINYAVAPPIFLGLDFLPACVAALVAGLITAGKTKYAIGLYAVILAVFLVLPLSTFWIQTPGGYQVPYTWLHIAALIVLVSPLGLSAYKWTKTSIGGALVLGVLVTVLSATMAQHLTGGVLYELILFPTFKITTPAKAYLVWSFLFYLYPVERFVITAVTTLFGVSIIRALRTTGLEEVLARIRRPAYTGPAPHQAVDRVDNRRSTS
jgi:hypothetical protein